MRKRQTHQRHRGIATQTYNRATQTYRHTDRQTYRHTDIQTYRHTGIELIYRRSMKTHIAVCEEEGAQI